MLTTLRIKNLALVADLTIDLQPGLNVISGETGAGKSILIGALTLVLGHRADRTLIRSGSETCTVEAVFDIATLAPPLNPFLVERGLEPAEENSLVIKRVFTTAGANRQFVNGSPTTLSTLAELGERLVDIHGPHDHQSLLHPARQLAIIDAFGNLEPRRAAFAALIEKRSSLESQKAELIVDERTYAQQLDLLRFQVQEITAARLDPGEELTLEQAHQRAGNSVRLLDLCQRGTALLGDDETSLLRQAASLGRILHDLARVDSGAEKLRTPHENALAAWQELQEEFSRYADAIDVDPEQLALMEERLNFLQTLKRKYGPTLADVVAFGEQAADKLQQLEQRDTELLRINNSLASLEKEVQDTGRDLSARRHKLVAPLNKAVLKELAALGFRQCQFDITFTSDHSSPRTVSSGFDSVEFQFSPNQGEPLRPLRAIASSGEMARVMLALKTVLAAQDDVPVLVFDEVDANVGGETAHAVGEKMQQVARRRQVLCITHLAPVAAHADAHYVVQKKVVNGRTISEISRLEKDERISELARMMGGQSDAARRHAAALLKSGPAITGATL